MLKPSFPDANAGPGVFYCPHTATVEGILTFYPAIRDRLDVRYVEFPRPRHEVIAEIGEEHQACPVLVVPAGWDQATPPGRQARGRTFFVGAEEIGSFLAAWLGIARPHP